MLPNSVALRSTAVAFVFPAQPELKHEENFKFYSTLTASGVELPEFTQARNQVVLRSRRPGTPPSVLQVRVDHHGPHLRFLVSDDFPSRPFEITSETADLAWDAFTSVWPMERLGGQPILTEVKMRLTVATEGNNATQFLAEKTLHLDEGHLRRLGRGLQGVGLRLMSPIQIGSGVESVPLHGADLNLQIETLLDDTSRLFIEATSKWPSVALPSTIVAQGAPSRLNFDLRKPSEYLNDMYSYTTEHVMNFLRESST
jgi:hypothetical protein